MKVKAITVIWILLTFVFATFAQEKPKTETKSTEIEIVSLPNTANSWIINIHQRGGIMGIHKLLLAINSDGKYVCGESGKVKTLASTETKFLELAELIKPLDSDIFLKPIIEEFAYCSDCLYSTLSFRRNKEKVKDGEIVEVASKQTVVPTAKEISEKVWKTVSCE